MVPHDGLMTECPSLHKGTSCVFLASLYKESVTLYNDAKELVMRAVLDITYTSRKLGWENGHFGEKRPKWKEFKFYHPFVKMIDTPNDENV